MPFCYQRHVFRKPMSALTGGRLLRRLPVDEAAESPGQLVLYRGNRCG